MVEDENLVHQLLAVSSPAENAPITLRAEYANVYHSESVVGIANGYHHYTVEVLVVPVQAAAICWCLDSYVFAIKFFHVAPLDV